jgi:glycosyltransferase involved in cell wall biosynthesis
MDDSQKKFSISVVVPAFNEEKTLEITIEELVPVLNEVSDIWEIIIIDDASVDNTPKIAKQLSEKYDRVRVLTNLVNKKLGGSLKRGYYSAKYDLICYVDSDLPIDFQEIKRAARYIKRCDMLCAYRFDRTCEGIRRVILSYSYNILISILFQISIRDINFSFKVFRRSLLDKIQLESEGSFTDAELIIKTYKLGYKILQMGVDYFPRMEGVSTLSSFPVILKILSDIIKTWIKMYIYRKIN